MPEVQVEELARLWQAKRLLRGPCFVDCTLRRHVVVSLPLATSCTRCKTLRNDRLCFTAE